MLKITILIFGICFFSTKVLAEYEITKYFPLTPGIRWVYSIGQKGEKEKIHIVTVEGVERLNGKETIKVAYKKGDQIDYDFLFVDSEGVWVYKSIEEGVPTLYTPPKILFPARLEEGENFSFSYSWVTYDSEGKVDVTGKSKVVITFLGFENVSTELGFFKDCLKFSVAKVVEEDSGDFAISSRTIWLAPNIGKIKESISTTEYDSEEGSTSKFFEELELKRVINN